MLTCCQRNRYEQHNHLFSRSTYGTRWVFCHVLLRTASIHGDQSSLIIRHLSISGSGYLALLIGQRHVPSYLFIVSHSLRTFKFVHMSMSHFDAGSPSRIFRASAVQATLFWLVSFTDCPSNSIYRYRRGRGVSSSSYSNGCTAFGSFPNYGIFHCHLFHFCPLSWHCYSIVCQMLAFMATRGNEVSFSHHW